MKVAIDKCYPVGASADTAWKFLQDINSVASFMPGAEITEQIDDTHFKGKVRVKIGPAVAAFDGKIEVQGIDAVKKELRLLATGADTKGTSSASMNLTASIQASEQGRCNLIGQSEVTVNGKLASFGGRMMDSVSNRILQQFADNFANGVIAKEDGAGSETATKKVPHATKELNGLAIAWHVFVDFIKGLFNRESKQA